MGITAKFLDKEKSIIRYNSNHSHLEKKRREIHQEHESSHSDLEKRTGSRKEKHKDKHLVSPKQISPSQQSLESRTIQTEQTQTRPRSPSHVPVRGGGKGHSFFRSPERVSESKLESRGERSKSPKKKQSPSKSHNDDTDDEVSEKKRRLLSRVLAPAKKSRHPSSGYELEDERRLTIDIEEEMLR